METRAETRTAFPATPASLVTFDRIEAALRAVPVTRLPEVYEILLAMLEEAEDLAAVEAAKDEPTVPWENVIADAGVTEPQLQAIAQAEGWLK
jgi:hypothetical protein